MEKKKHFNNELEKKAINYLISHQSRKITDFCRKEKISYQYFVKKFSIKNIYKQVDIVLCKKQTEKLNIIESELIKQGKIEAFDIKNLFDDTFKILNRSLSYLDKNNIKFKSEYEAIKTFKDITLLLLQLKNEVLLETKNNLKDNSYQCVVDEVKKLVDFKKSLSEDDNQKESEENINKIKNIN